ncbi:MAG: DegV family protein [Clostridiales bacterium]|nr:DegV family protein [Clostridiales bacterium]
MSYKIAIDSCGELLDEWKQDDRIESIPLTLMVGKETIIDDETFDQLEYLKKVAECPECPKTACPSPENYRKVFDCDADHVYGITLSAELSGSYNSALLGKDLVLEENPEKKIHIFNSCSASVGETLIALKIQACEEAGLPFEDIVSVVEKYIEEQDTFFVLENLDTLRKNGRLTGVKSLVAGALKIKPVMGATPEGTIIQLSQARGMNRAIVKMVDIIEEKRKSAKNLIMGISHCNCPERARMLAEALQKRMNPDRIVVLNMGGLSTTYANDGGVIVVL